MGSPDVGRSKHVPFRIEPERGQIPENAIEPSNSERCDVFHEDETGSKDANDPSELGPEPGLFSVDTDTLSSVGDVLAGKAAADDVGSLGSLINLPHVVEAANAWPVFREHCPRIRIALGLPDDLVPERFKREVEPPNPREERANPHAATSPSPTPTGSRAAALTLARYLAWLCRLHALQSRVSLRLPPSTTTCRPRLAPS